LCEEIRVCNGQNARTLTDEPQRLSKAVAALMRCSRREAEQYVAEGWVRVDGQLAQEPQTRVASNQRVEVDPKAQLQPVAAATFLVHKPARATAAQARALLEAASHWDGDTSGIRRVKSHSVGVVELLPLPDEASGLTVFSQDGRIVRKLTEDAWLIEQELIAEVTGTIASNGLDRLCRGLAWQGKPLPPAHVSWQSETRLRFAVKGIVPERVPWMCAQVGLQLTALRRIRIGRVPMARMPPGQWRYLALGERF
jgi:23S rRNA pseudouridine2604 synthase